MQPLLETVDELLLAVGWTGVVGATLALGIATVSWRTGLALAVAFNFAGFFVYIASAPVFLIDHLGLGSREFAWLFVPMVAGVMLGAWISGRVAGRLAPGTTIGVGYVVMFAGSFVNVGLNALMPPALPWAVLPMFTFACGSSLIMPTVTLLLLDLFPRARGMVSSLQGFVQILFSAFVAGALAPFLAQSPSMLAFAMLGFATASYLLWLSYRRSFTPSSF